MSITQETVKHVCSVACTSILRVHDIQQFCCTTYLRESSLVVLSYEPWTGRLVFLHREKMYLLNVILLYIYCNSQRTDWQWAGGFPFLIQSRGEVGENPLCKFVFECVYCCQVISVDEHYLSFVTVQLNCNFLRLLFQHELGARRRLSPEWVSVAQANHPETLSGVEKDCSLSFDGVLGHSNVPVFTLANLYSPAVLSRCEASCSKHADTVGAAFRVIWQLLFCAVLYTGQLFREL